MMTLKEQQQAFAGHIRAGKAGGLWGIDAQRMAVYRRLFFNNIEGYLGEVFTDTTACVGEGRWRDIVQRFFAEAEMTTPIYRDLPGEFILWASTQAWPDLPPYWLEMAHFEALQMALVFAPDAGAQTWLQPQAVVGYSHPLYQWEEGKVLSAVPCFITVYRGRDGKVRWLVLSALQARFLELAQNNPEQSPDDILTLLHTERPLFHDKDIVLPLRQHGVMAAL